MKTLHLSIIIVVTLTILISSHTVFAFATDIVVQTASFNGKQGTYAIPYNMTNGKLVASLLDLPAKEFIFTINATGDGKLTVELPRKIIDSTRDGKDKPYLVYIGTWETGLNRIKANEIQNDNKTRTLAIDFTKRDNQIGIVGTYFIENNSTAVVSNTYGDWTPLQQYNKGFDAQYIICKQGLQLVRKSEDETPACVKPDTAQKLVERGWGVLKEQMVWFVYNPIACQQTPWGNYVPKIFANRTIAFHLTEIGKINSYFKEQQGVTIIQSLWTNNPNEQMQPPLCGQPAHFSYYFLVPEIDANKMTGLGYKTVDNVPTYAKPIK